MKKRKKVAVYIDGENISARKLDKINAIFEREGQLISANVYRRKNDKFTKRWHNIGRRRESMKEISINGTSQRDKIDKRIIRDINRDIRNNSDIDVVILFSSDHGYAQTVEKIAGRGKEVIVAGKNISNRLKVVAGAYYEI